MASKPALEMPAPTMPPINAWELDEGMPASQVMMFHAIAPASAPKITLSSTSEGETMPAPTVFATCRPKNRKAMKLKKAAQATACCGFRTLVDTMVAMELAASCRPLRKSKSRATPIRTIRYGVTDARSMMLLRARQRCSITMPTMVLATSSKRSDTFSRWP
jgi:hypothetical protein